MERRRSQRQCVSLALRFKFLGSRSPVIHESRSRDISAGGMFINYPLKDEELGKEASLELDLPDNPIPIKAVKARTAWVQRNFEGKISGFGVEFLQIEPDQKDRLHTYILRVASDVPLKFKSIRPPDYKLSDKEKRGLEILDVLRRGSPISKTQIAQEVNLNIVTISNYIDEFRKKGLICERGLDESSGGRRPSLLELNGGYSFVLGVELNLERNFIAGMLLDFGFRIIARNRLAINKTPMDIVDKVTQEVFALVEEARVDRSRILGLGLGTTGGIENNYAGLKDSLEEKLRLPLIIEDALVAKIYNEVWQDPDLAVKENVLYIDLDGRLSMILKGSLYRGSNGASLRMGLNETRTTDEDNHACWLKDDCLLRLKMDAITQKNAHELGRSFGAKVAYLANMLNPQVIMINRSAEGIPELFFVSLKNAVKRWVFRESVKNVEVIISKYNEDSVAQGAAALVLRDIYSQI